MALRLDCPMDGCHATIEADSEEEVMAQVESHAESKHSDVELDDETVETIRSSIQQV